ATVNELQLLRAAGIETRVFAVNPGSAFLSTTQAQAFANAGAGANVNYPGNVYFQCSMVAPWVALEKSYGRPAMQPLGAYQAPAGTTASITLTTSSPSGVESALLANTSGLKSCVFDLSGAKVDLTKLAQANVAIDGFTVPHTGANAWRMNSTTKLELLGKSCTLWRDPTTESIAFDFPCDVLQ